MGVQHCTSAETLNMDIHTLLISFIRPLTRDLAHKHKNMPTQVVPPGNNVVRANTFPTTAGTATGTLSETTRFLNSLSECTSRPTSPAPLAHTRKVKSFDQAQAKTKDLSLSQGNVNSRKNDREDNIGRGSIQVKRVKSFGVGTTELGGEIGSGGGAAVVDTLALERARTSVDRCPALMPRTNGKSKKRVRTHSDSVVCLASLTGDVHASGVNILTLSGEDAAVVSGDEEFKFDHFTLGAEIRELDELAWGARGGAVRRPAEGNEDLSTSLAHMFDEPRLLKALHTRALERRRRLPCLHANKRERAQYPSMQYGRTHSMHAPIHSQGLGDFLFVDGEADGDIELDWVDTEAPSSVLDPTDHGYCRIARLEV